MESNEIRTFEGQITKIDDSKVQSHIEEVPLGRDKYVECRFRNREAVIPLSNGDIVKMYGYLDDVNDAIRFKNCALIGRTVRPPRYRPRPMASASLPTQRCVLVRKLRQVIEVKPHFLRGFRRVEAGALIVRNSP